MARPPPCLAAGWKVSRPGGESTAAVSNPWRGSAHPDRAPLGAQATWLKSALSDVLVVVSAPCLMPSGDNHFGTPENLPSSKGEMLSIFLWVFQVHTETGKTVTPGPKGDPNGYDFQEASMGRKGQQSHDFQDVRAQAFASDRGKSPKTQVYGPKGQLPCSLEGPNWSMLAL